MVRRSETFGTTGRVTAAAEVKQAAHAAPCMITISEVHADDDFPELNR